MKLVYHDDYFLPIGEHVFAGEKFKLVAQSLLAQRQAEPGDFVTPAAAGDDDVLLVHTPEWVRSLRQGTLTRQEETRLEIPYSSGLVRAFWLHAGGSIRAAELALHDGVAVNLGGGFHHAFPAHGEGFCMINDIAIALRRMIHDGKIAQGMVVDCDVHQGNGTAAIFNPQGEPDYADEVFTISLHQENNYPAWKPPSSLDVNLRDGTSDSEYLAQLDQALTSSLRRFVPQLIAYVAGADPYTDDQLGGLSLSLEGLKRRDEMVFQAAKSRRIPIFVCYAGGYARRLEDTVKIHANTVIAAKEVFGCD